MRSRSDRGHPGGAPISGQVVCTHCGLPVPLGLVESGREEQFCCNGCRTVYAMIHGCGLDRFYRLRALAEAPARQASTTDRRYREYDDPVFRATYCDVAADGTATAELFLEGVHCAACVWLVEKLPRVVPGTVEARLDMRRSLVRIRWEHQRVPLSRIARALDALGYPPHPARDAKSRAIRRQEDHRFLVRLGVAAACAGNVMTLSFALYGGVFTGIETQYSRLFRIASMAFGLVALTWPGSFFFRGAWAAIRTRTAHLDLPIALALAAGGAAGTLNAVLGRGEIYFDSLTMLVFLLLLGRWLQRRHQRWTTDAMELLYSLTPTSARRIETHGEISEVPIEAVSAGDLLEVRAGDSVPIDGEVVDGDSTIDRSLLTGESLPVRVGKGDRVHAGTLNCAARLVVRAEATGSQTRVGQLMQLVEECGRRRAPIVQFADRVAGWFVIVVLALALFTFALWLALDSSSAIDRAVALLIVTCPCALGLATPVAIAVALGRAARRQILIKGGEVLERLAREGTIFLDKTGTLTRGRSAVTDWFGDDGVRKYVAALERHSSHPIARALVDATQDSEPQVPASPDVREVHQVAGAGLTGVVRGLSLVVGSPRFVRDSGCRVPPDMAVAVADVIGKGATPVLVGANGECVAVAALTDPLRDDAAEAVEGLRRAGWRPCVLSGDHPEVVASVARRLGIPETDTFGGTTPEEKVARVQHAIAAGPVVMVGDGVNDAAALSAATVGIAVHGGAEASLSAADVYLNRPGLTPILEIITASRRTLRTIRQCLAVSLCYNAVAAALAITGLIGPLTAAVLMPISSFSVLVIAFTARTFDGVMK